MFALLDYYKTYILFEIYTFFRVIECEVLSGDWTLEVVESTGKTKCPLAVEFAPFPRLVDHKDRLTFFLSGFFRHSRIFLESGAPGEVWSKFSDRKTQTRRMSKDGLTV